MAPDIQAYTAVMEEIKRRVAVVEKLRSNNIALLYPATQVESTVLQVRMITELVALASLAANKSIFEENRRKFDKHWDPVKILKDVERLNPEFYPKPVVEARSETPGVKTILVDMTSGFMEQDELIEVHGRCGNVLHARNPYAEALDYGAYDRIVPTWMSRITALLNCHRIKLLDGDSFYLVHMHEAHDGRVHMYTFQRTDA
jgi:hypothetical protein